MKPENEQFLKDTLHHFVTLERAFYLRGLNVHEREGMQRVMGEEFHPGYRADLTCPACVADMVKMLYRSYYNYLKAKWNDSTAYSDLTEGIQQLMNKVAEPIVKEAEPITEPAKIIEAEPLKVAANFPSNKPKKKRR